VLASAQTGPDAVRIAAIQSLTQIGNASVVPQIVEMTTAADANIASAAQVSLASFSGQEADARHPGPCWPSRKPRPAASASTWPPSGGIASAMPALLKAAEDADESVRVAAYKALNDVAGAKEIPAMLDLLVKTKTRGTSGRRKRPVVHLRAAGRPRGRQRDHHQGDVRKYAGWPFADVTAKVIEIVKAGTLSIDVSNEHFGDAAPGKVKQLQVDYSVEGVPNTKTVNEGETMTLTAVTRGNSPFTRRHLLRDVQAPLQPKLALLRVLRSVADPKSLAAVRAAASDATPEVKDTALRACATGPRRMPWAT